MRPARALAACGLALLVLAAPAAAQQVVPNPVIPGDAADPSVVRAAGFYWAAATSGQWAPVFPLYRSRDLVHWRQVGSVFPRPPRWARGNFWAPGIGVAGGTWSVYYSASRSRGPACIAVAQARSPYGPWRDRGVMVCQPGGSIDPAPVTDAAGVHYLVWKQKGVGGGIWIAPLTEDGADLAAPAIELIVPDRGWEQGTTEGPDIVEHDGAYFLVYSGGHCCRPPCTYAVGVAQASEILGPYTKDADNPVFHSGNGWKCPGHGTLVTEPDGSLGFLHHAYPDTPGSVHREGLLDPVTWGPDGWPVFGDDGAPVGDPSDGQALRLLQAFSGRSLQPGWEWPYNDAPSLQLHGGVLRILRGTISRAWSPRSYALEARADGPAQLGVSLTADQAIVLRGVPGGADLLVDGRRVTHLDFDPRHPTPAAAPAPRRKSGRKGRRVKRRPPPPAPRALRLDVRDGQGFMAFALGPYGWRAVGRPYAFPRGEADRVLLGPGAFEAVSLTPLAAGPQGAGA